MPVRRSRIIALALLPTIALLAIHATVRADPLPAPTGRVLLSITGAIAHTNTPGRAEFDHAMLVELGLVTRVVDTPYNEPGARFEGVPAKRLMARVGARGKTVEAIGANDFRTRLPLADLTDHPVLLALSMNGERLRLRDKGPIWLLYENEGRPGGVPENVLNGRMVWQLGRLNVLE